MAKPINLSPTGILLSQTKSIQSLKNFFNVYLQDPFLYMDFDSLNLEMKYRIHRRFLGSFYQSIGIPPTPMFETGFHMLAMHVLYDGIYVPDYGYFVLEILNPRDSFGIMYDPVDEEIKIIEKEFEVVINKVIDTLF